jgi:hypothetical protein
MEPLALSFRLQAVAVRRKGESLPSIRPSLSTCPRRYEFSQSIRTGWYVIIYITRLLQLMRSDSLAVARRAKGPQPLYDIFDPRFHYFRILSILCQRAIAFDHRDQ